MPPRNEVKTVSKSEGPASPVEAAGAMKMWKTKKLKRFSTVSQRLGKLAAAKNKDAAASFPQLPQGLLLGYVLGRKSKTWPCLVGEYPIDVWHGDIQCPTIPDEYRPDSV